MCISLSLYIYIYMYVCMYVCICLSMHIYSCLNIALHTAYYQREGRRGEGCRRQPTDFHRPPAGSLLHAISYYTTMVYCTRLVHIYIYIYIYLYTYIHTMYTYIYIYIYS